MFELIFGKMGQFLLPVFLSDQLHSFSLWLQLPLRGDLT